MLLPTSDIQTPRILTEFSKSGHLQGANEQNKHKKLIYQPCGQLANQAASKILKTAESRINTGF
jgi:hypothetical protein